MNELKIFSNTDFGELSVNNTDDGIYFFWARCVDV